MADFSDALGRIPIVLNPRKIVDRTGVSGQFDFRLKLEEDDPLDDAHSPRAPRDDFEPLQAALQKVGLQLVATKAPEDIIVIDHVERPSQN